MKTLKTIVLKNFTAARADALRKQAEIRGIDLKGDYGDFKFSQCVINYLFDPKAETVTLNPSVPYFITEEQFLDRLKEFLADGFLPEWDGTKIKDERAEDLEPVEIVEGEEVKDFAAQPAGPAIAPTPEANAE